MKIRSSLTITLLFLFACILLGGCTTPATTCTFTPNTIVTAYRLPDETSDVFGIMPSGESYQALARTSDGWVGFDPGIAQAGNIGLAHHRWIQVNITLSSWCLTSVDLVTLEDVLADLAASNP